MTAQTDNQLFFLDPSDLKSQGQPQPPKLERQTGRKRESNQNKSSQASLLEPLPEYENLNCN